jgi:hypothetical protein
MISKRRRDIQRRMRGSASTSAAGGAPYPKLTVTLLKKYRKCDWTRTRFNRSLKKKRVFALGATTRSIEK